MSLASGGGTRSELLRRPAPPGTVNRQSVRHAPPWDPNATPTSLRPRRVAFANLVARGCLRHSPRRGQRDAPSHLTLGKSRFAESSADSLESLSCRDTDKECNCTLER